MSVKRKIPMRQCIGCRDMKSKKELLRILRTPEGQFVIDTTGKKNGRGAYLCRNAECFEAAAQSKGLERAFQCGVSGAVYEALLKEFKGLEAE